MYNENGYYQEYPQDANSMNSCNQMMWQRNQQKLWENEQEVITAGNKEIARQTVKRDFWLYKEAVKERMEENKRGIHEEIEVTPEGDVQIITRNLSFAAVPRSVINLQKPSITILKRLADTTEQIYLLNCTSRNQEKRIFLDKEKAGNGSYLVKKLGSEGICFKTDKAARKKDMALQLLSVLLAVPAGEKILPDESGYYELPDGNLKYVEEGGLTWNIAKKQSR